MKVEIMESQFGPLSAPADLTAVSAKPDAMSRGKKVAIGVCMLTLIAVIGVGPVIDYPLGAAVLVGAFWLVCAVLYYFVSEIAKLTGDAE